MLSNDLSLVMLYTRITPWDKWRGMYVQQIMTVTLGYVIRTADLLWHHDSMLVWDSEIFLVQLCPWRGSTGGKKGGREGGRTLDCCACKNGQLAYHICNLILLPSSSMVLILKSTPAWRDGEVNNSVEGKLSVGILSLIQGNYFLCRFVAQMVSSHFVNSHFVNSHLVNFPIRNWRSGNKLLKYR